MKTYRETIKLQTIAGRPSFHKITDEVKKIAKRSGICNGICVIYSHHTTCSLMMQEDSMDETYAGLDFMQHDLCEVLEKIIPTCRVEGQYYHPGPKATQFAASVGEDKPFTLNTDGHLRSVFIGRSETIVLFDGEMDLGEFGHLYFIDFDITRPRNREVQVQVMGE